MKTATNLCSLVLTPANMNLVLTLNLRLLAIACVNSSSNFIASSNRLCSLMYGVCKRKLLQVNLRQFAFSFVRYFRSGSV